MQREPAQASTQREQREYAKQGCEHAVPRHVDFLVSTTHTATTYSVDDTTRPVTARKMQHPRYVVIILSDESVLTSSSCRISRTRNTNGLHTHSSCIGSAVRKNTNRASHTARRLDTTLLTSSAAWRRTLSCRRSTDINLHSQQRVQHSGQPSDSTQPINQPVAATKVVDLHQTRTYRRVYVSLGSRMDATLAPSTRATTLSVSLQRAGQGKGDSPGPSKGALPAPPPTSTAD